MNKRVLVIGGGVSGLTAAIYAAQAGFTVNLYEKHTIVGGECTGWDRKGYHIDNCIHWMNGTAPGSSLYRLWETTGALGPNVTIYQPDRMYTSEYGGDSITLWKDLKRTERELLALSPDDEAEIHKLMHACRIGQKVRIPAGKAPGLQSPWDGIKMLCTMGPALKLFQQYAGMDCHALSKRFRHPLIGYMITDFCTPESLASSFPLSYGSFCAGDGGVPAGGSRATAYRMGERLKQLGGSVYTSKEAERILIQGNRATGVCFSDGSMEEADYVIPACDANIIFTRLLPVKYMPPLFHDFYEKRDAYPVYNTFQAAFALNSETDLVGPDKTFDCGELCFSPEMRPRMTVKSYSYEPTFAPKGKQIIQVLWGGSEKLYDFWKELYENHPQVYLAKKEEIAAGIQQVLERRFPDCRGKLVLLDTWTPMTYQRYCSAYKGFYQACTITTSSVKLPYSSPVVDGLENVFLAGQWMNPPGGLPGAATAGMYAVQYLARKEKIRI